MAPTWSLSHMFHNSSARPIYQKMNSMSPKKKKHCNLPPYHDSFEQFSQLIPELRIKIWGFACYHPQTIEISSGTSRVRLISKASIPAILQANSESRHEALKVYKILCGRCDIEGNRDALHSSPAYFNSVVDTIYVEQNINICSLMRMCECTNVTPIDGAGIRCILPSSIENLAQLVNININPSNSLTRLDLGGIRYLTLKYYWRNGQQWKALLNNLYWPKYLESVQLQISHAFLHEWIKMFSEREYQMHLSSCEPRILREEQTAAMWARRTLEGAKDIKPGTIAEYIRRVLGDELVVYAQVQKMIHEAERFVGNEFLDFTWSGWWGDIVKISSKAQLGLTLWDFNEAIARMQELEIQVVMF